MQLLMAGAVAGVAFLAATANVSNINTTPAVILGLLFIAGSAAALALDQNDF